MNNDVGQAKLKHIHDSFQAAWDALPAYRHMLPFFESLFTLQEAAVAVTSPEPADTSPELIAVRLKSHLPMIDRGRMSYDKAAALDLLQSLCRQAATDRATPQLSAGAEKLLADLKNERPLIAGGFGSFLRRDTRAVRDLGARLDMDESILAFFLYHSIWPAIARQIHMFPEADRIAERWHQSYCPMCGGAPSLAFLAENGARILVCEFCRRQWPFKRITCPWCGNTDGKTLSYFFDDGEPACRVYTCDACKKYIKTVDTRCLTRPFYPPLENIVTTHLDLRAGEMGYGGTGCL